MIQLYIGDISRDATIRKRETGFTKVQRSEMVVDKNVTWNTRRNIFAYQLFVKWFFCELVGARQ